MEPTEKRRRSLFGPGLLIGIGLLLLLNNFGWVTVDVWELVVRFWPLALIAAGLDLLLGRRSFVGGLLALLLLGAIVVGALNFGATESAPLDQANAQTIAQPLEGASQAVIKIDADVSRLQVSGYPQTTQLIEGRLIPHPDEDIGMYYSKEGDTAYYTLASEGVSRFWPNRFWPNRFWPNFGRNAAGLWELRLHQTTPIALNISTGVGNARLDLDHLQLTVLEVNIGVGQAMITLPSHGNFTANIDGGIGQVLVLIPDTMAAVIRADAGIGSVRVEGDYQPEEEEKVYSSPNYEGAADRVDLSIEGGIGSITVRQIEAG